MTSNPWFGPTARAEKFLSKRQRVIEPEAALARIVSVLETHASAIQHVRFIDFVHRDKGFRFTIALMWIASDPEARDAVYESASVLVDQTGWYPLPAGERLASRRSFRPLKGRIRRSGAVLPAVSGSLASIESVVKPEDGAAIRVRTTSGDSLLLDTGFPRAFSPAFSDKIVLLSHSHADHAGGVTSPSFAGLPVVMSLDTARVLVGSGEPANEEPLLSRTVTAMADRAIPLGTNLTVIPFRAPHCPGSLGFELRDDEVSLFYTGDVALASARHDSLAELARRVIASPAARKTVLVDATMAGRSAGVSLADPAPALLARGDDDFVLVASDPSQLAYAYIDMFQRTLRDASLRHRRSFIMSSRARTIFEMLHSAYVGRKLAELDPFIASQYGTSMSAWAESRSLYWLESLVKEPTAPRVWLLADADLQSWPSRRIAPCALIGRELRTPPPLQLEQVEIDTSVWTQHSSEGSLIDAVQKLSLNARVVLFHNYESRLAKFITRNALIASAITRAPIRL